jgi:RNase P subunit RPR2
MSKAKKKAKSKLVPLAYGTGRWCERCKKPLTVGERVGWWRVRGYGGRRRPAVYCRECHWANVHAGEPLR